jgi:hypothetical protein
MSQGTCSEVASVMKSGIESGNDDENEDDKPSSLPFITQNKSLSRNNSGSGQSYPSPSTMVGSMIISHTFGPLYPIPQSTDSPQIAAYQNGLKNISNRIFHNARALAQWHEDLLAQALLLNMHEYFSGQIVFAIHPACDAMYHIQHASAAPFQMKVVKDNIRFLENTSPSTLVFPSSNDHYTIQPTTVYITKKQLEVVEYISKFTGHFIHTIMNLPGNTNYLRLITFNYKITITQSVQMLAAIYKYAVTNQQGRDIPLLCKQFYSLQPCTFEYGVHYLELVQSALHRHKYTHFSNHHCDVTQLIFCLYPGNLKKNLIDANKKSTLNWSVFKNEADIIVSTLQQAGQSLYDQLPTIKNFPSIHPEHNEEFELLKIHGYNALPNDENIPFINFKNQAALPGLKHYKKSIPILSVTNNLPEQSLVSPKIADLKTPSVSNLITPSLAVISPSISVPKRHKGQLTTPRTMYDTVSSDYNKRQSLQNNVKSSSTNRYAALADIDDDNEKIENMNKKNLCHLWDSNHC